jgi:MFS family permease
MRNNAAGASGAGRSISALARAREVFSNVGFRRYFMTRTISQLGDGVFQLAVGAVFLFENPGPNPVIPLLTVSAVTLIPFSALGPFVGVFIDRWDRRKIIVRMPIGRALITLLLPIAGLAGTHSAPFVIVVIVILSANRFFLATMSAVLPQLVPEDDLLVANSAATTGGAIANVAGQAVGTLVAGAIGGERAAVLAALGFLAATVQARNLEVHRGLEPQRAPLWDEVREVLSEMMDGAREVARDRRVVFALTAITVTQIMVGALIAVLTYYFIAVLHLQVRSAGVVLGFLALGIGIGVVLVPLVARRIHEDLVLTMSFVIAGLGAVFAAGHLSRNTLIIGAAVIGAAYAFAKIPVDTIVQEEIADEVRGRAFALYDMIFNLARVTGIALVAWLYEAGAKTDTIIGLIAAGYAVAAIVFFGWERSAMFRRRRRVDAASLLVPGEIVTVRAYEGMRADEEPRVVVIGGNELAISSVEWRAVVEDRSGGRRRVFVCTIEGRRVRLSVDDESTWMIERIMPIAEPEPQDEPTQEASKRAP